MRKTISLVLLSLLSVSCMTQQDKIIYAEVFGDKEKAAPVAEKPEKPAEAVKKAEGKTLEVN
ncbi:MAG: hypothetical protein HRU19_10140 [Pseudobacteriovorax sp.]|nr:hypothetical protein [Pseudobacteriovorax sp.]